MLAAKDIRATAFKFRCEPEDPKPFRQIFEQQSILAADLCNELFDRTWSAWRDQEFPDRWRSIYKQAKQEIWSKYRGRLPDAVFAGCASRVEAEFDNGAKRSQFQHRLNLPRFSAKAIPLRSDRGMRFEEFDTPKAKLGVRVRLTLLHGHQAQPVVCLYLRDGNALATMERILKGYRARCQRRGRGRKEMLVSEDSWPPSSGGSVSWDRDRDKFYLSIGFSRPKVRAKNPDPNRIMAIDVGIASPLTVAFSWNKRPFRLDEIGQMILDTRGSFYKRRRLEQAKFAAAPRKVYRQRIGKLSEKWQGELQKLMGNVCACIRRIVEQNCIGQVRIDRPSAQEPTFFAVHFRGEKFKVPIATLLDMLEEDLKELLGEKNVHSRSFYWSSQICSCCGAWNKDFNWEYRRENGWPDFHCSHCSATIDADINAARTMLREDYEQIVRRILKQRDKAAPVFDR